MPDLPSGTVTFLLTDIEGSTRLWEQDPEAMSAYVARHDATLAECIARHGGAVVRTRGEGDSVFAAFAWVRDAVAATCDFQRVLQATFKAGAPSALPLRVRAAMHTGEAELREGDYYGTAVNRCARLREIAHGGQVLLSGTAAQIVGDELPEGVALRSLGRHRLRDLQRPEQIYQLLHPELPAEFPPLNSLDARPNNLPQQLTSFIGREREIATVKELLAGTRLLTLVGAGGCGKTRLSIQVAAELLEEYEDGVWLVELAALTDPTLVPQAVATVLGVREEAGRPLLATLTDHLQRRRLLLLLDNCEHLTAAVATLAHGLLRACPHLRILATSREVLGVGGEATRRVPSLSLPEVNGRPAPGDVQRQLAVASWQSAAQSEAVRLFADRALASRPGFTLGPQTAPTVARVCRRLDGIPLAIELAAARVRVLSVEQIEARLDDCFRLLTGGSRTAMPRQQTLRALIDWSYDLLSPEERVLWQRLSVFVGGFTLEAAEAVASDEVGSWQWAVGSGEGAPSSLPTAHCNEFLPTALILDLLGQLIDKSLVIVEEPGDDAFPGGGDPRYRLLETIRQYGWERLGASGEESIVRDRHRDWFLALAEQGEAGLIGPGQREWLQRLDVDHANLRAAIAWSIECGESEAALRLCGVLWRFWAIRGYWSEGRDRLAAALAVSPAPQPDPRSLTARAKALHGAGGVAHYQGDYAAARAYFEGSLAIRRELGDRRSVAGTLHNLGSTAEYQGDYAAARSLYEESLAIRRELGDQQGIAGSLNNLGEVARRLGDYEVARALYEESLAIKRRLGDTQGIANSLSNLALTTLYQGDLDRARALYEESLTVRRELGDRSGIATSLQGLGNVAFYRGDYATAWARHEESLSIRRDLGNRQDIATSLLNLAEVARRQGGEEQAAARYAESLELFRATGERQGIAECLEGIAGLRGARGDAERAARLLGAAAALREVAGAPVLPCHRALYDRDVAVTRDALGADAFDALWSAGQQMSLDEMLAEAAA